MPFHNEPSTAGSRPPCLLAPIAGLIVALTAAASVAEADTCGTVLAVVNHDTICSRDVDEMLLEAHGSMGGESMRRFDARKLLKKLINDRLLIQEARYMEIDREQWLVESVDQLRLEHGAALYARENYKPDLGIDSVEIDEYFKKYYARMQIRTLAVGDRSRAEAIVEAIRQGADMDSIAVERSRDSHRLTGGLHSFSYYGDIETVYRDQADRLSVGELSDPFPYRDVYTMVRLERVAEADPADLPGLILKITSVLSQWKNEISRRSFLDSLTDVYPITEDSAVLSDIVRDSARLFTPHFMEGSDRKALVGPFGYYVTEDRLRKKISREAMTTANDPFDSIFIRSKEAATIDLALRAGAKANGYLDRPAIEKACGRFLDSTLIEVYLQQTVVPKVIIDPSVIEANYIANQDVYRNPSRYQFDRAFFDSDTLAKAALSRIRNGADFGFVVNQSGGRLGAAEESAEWLGLSTFPAEMQRDIAALPIAGCTDPIQTDEGWLVLQVRSLKKGSVRPLSEVAIAIKSRIFAAKFAAVMDETLELLKHTYGVWLDDSAIDQYFDGE